MKEERARGEQWERDTTSKAQKYLIINLALVSLPTRYLLITKGTAITFQWLTKQSDSTLVLAKQTTYAPQYEVPEENFSFISLSKLHNLILMIRKYQTTQIVEYFTNNFKTKKPWKISAMCNPGLDPRPQKFFFCWKDITGRTKLK